MRIFFYSILLLLLITCKSKTDKPNSVQLEKPSIPIIFDQKKYNLEISPDTTIKCSMLIGRPVDKLIYNEPYYLDTNTYYRFFSAKGMNHRYRSLWPCNLPDLLTPGDTMLISGTIYSIFGDEKMSGNPFVISKILLNDKYKNGLSNLYR